MTSKACGIISLLTDFGLADEYVGVLKGVLLSTCPTLQIIDLCHNITPHNIHQAAAMLEASSSYFKDGTVHLAIVDPGVGTKRNILLVEAKNQFFIGPDNGIFTPFLQEPHIRKCYRLRVPEKNVSNTFHGRDIMAPAAAKIGCGDHPAELGDTFSAKDCVVFPPTTVRFEDGQMTGEIAAIDHFGNLITSISSDLLTTIIDKVIVTVRGVSITGISTAYADVGKGQLVALVNSCGKLEIATSRGNAARFLGAQLGDTVSLKGFPSD